MSLASRGLGVRKGVQQAKSPFPTGEVQAHRDVREREDLSSESGDSN